MMGQKAREQTAPVIAAVLLLWVAKPAPATVIQEAENVGTSDELAALVEEVLAFGREDPPALPLPPGTDERYGDPMQIMLHRENEELSELRRNASITAFVEGWALYAERLGLEVGFYSDPYSNFGRLTYEIWRACRLVVDTGIHAFGWTRQQAIDYMAENTALSIPEVTTEVDRYIRSHGQALAYKIGEIKITELRRRAEDALGDEFDVREFHHAVLRNGSVPLAFLEQQIDQYIAETLAATT